MRTPLPYTPRHLLSASHTSSSPFLTHRGSFTLGRVIASLAAAVVSPVTLLLSSLPLAMFGALVALVAPAALMQQQGWLLLMVVTVLVGAGVAPGFANALALLDSYCPCTGSITGLLGGVAGAGCMSVPLVVALLAKHTVLQYQGLMWVSLVSFAAQLLCIPLALLIGRRVQQEREVALSRQGARYASVTKDLALQDGQQDGQHPSADQC